MVCIRKMPTNDSRGAYYKEYVYLGDGSPELKVTRYIVIKDGAYGVEITLCKGYVSGMYDGGIGVKILDKATNKVLLEEKLSSQVFKEPFEKLLLKMIKFLSDAVVEGQYKKDVKLMLYSFVPGMYYVALDTI